MQHAAAAPLSMQSDPAVIARTALGSLPGTVAAGVWRDGVAAYGQAPVAAAQDTLFEIGSISKVFTGLLLAQAVEQRELQLDDTLGKLLGGEIKLTANVAGITLRQLVTHSACLPRMPDNFKPEDGLRNPYRHYDRAALWSALSALSLPQAAPCSGDYSNMGFAVLGELLSRHYGKSWAQLVQERITGPLGMRDTALHPGDRAGRMAAPYAGRNPVSQWDFLAFAGAGGLRSTTADMMLFSKAVLAGRQGPLGAAAERLLQPLNQYQGGDIGYGVMMRGPARHRAYFHGGATGGYRASWLLLPDTNESLVVLASNAESAVDAAEGDIMAVRYGVATTRIATDSGTLPAYGGVYRIDAKAAFTFVAQDGMLHGRLTGQPFEPLTAAAPDVFTFPGVGAEFTFKREQGKVAAVTLRQRGAVVEAPRTAEAAPALASHAGLTQETYGGAYVSPNPPLSFDVKARAGQLIVQLSQQPALPVFPVAGKPDWFAYDVVAAETQFERNANGKVIALVLHQNGRAIRAERQAPAPLALEATPVYLRGSMNAWGTRDRLQAVAPGVYAVTLDLAQGEHQFKIGSEDWQRVDLGAAAGSRLAAEGRLGLSPAGENLSFVVPAQARYEFRVDASVPGAPQVSVRAL
jgi:CubicO group peptidase (beta-lactamase class C family)